MSHTVQGLEIHPLSVTIDNWLSLLKMPNRNRPPFLIEQNKLHIGQVTAKFIGIPHDEDEYYNMLYDLVSHDVPGIERISNDTLNKTIDNSCFQSIQKVLNIHREQGLSINRFVAFLDGEQLLLKSEIPCIHRKVREAMIKTLQLFSSLEEEGLKHRDLQRVLVDLVKWSFNHLHSKINALKLEESMLKFLWYGDTKKSHQYFLYYLIQLGCDVIMFSPSNRDPLDWIETFVHHYPNFSEPEPFPKEKRKRKSTVAFKASREIETILNAEGTGFYKPWQLRDYIPSSLTLKTTYDELFILIKEKAMIRPDFHVSEGRVTIPNVFAKIHGVSRNRKEYWERLHHLVGYDDSLCIKQFPFMRPTNNDYRYHYENALAKNGQLDPRKMISANYWRYQSLPMGLQEAIAHAIGRICADPLLRPLVGESKEEVKVYLFAQAMQLPNEFVKMMQKFDYSQEVPKFILYHNGSTGSLSREDAAALLLLNAFGFDIVLYSPSGQNDIERFLDSRLFDTHWLEDIVFDQEYKEPSAIKKLFMRGFFNHFKGD